MRKFRSYVGTWPEWSEWCNRPMAYRAGPFASSDFRQVANVAGMERPPTVAETVMLVQADVSWSGAGERVAATVATLFETAGDAGRRGRGGEMRIVAVEPDYMGGKLLRFVLTDAGHEVVLVTTVAAALGEVVGRETDAVLLEVDLPDRDGYVLCRELRARRYRGPLLVVATRRETPDKVRAFDHGADDYIVKPFDPLELLARVHAAARRHRQTDQRTLGTALQVGDAELLLGDLTFRIAGRRPALLTPTEMRLLECLMRNSNITIGRDTLIERTWGYDFIGDSNRVDVYIRRLRKKIERDPAAPEYLHTVRGIGYVFRPPAWAKLLDLEVQATAGDADAGLPPAALLDVVAS